MTTKADTNGIFLLLSLELMALDPEPAVSPFAPASLPPPRWRSESSADGKRVQALRWLVDCAPALHPREQRVRVTILGASDPVPDLSSAGSGSRWAQPTETRITCWSPVDYDRAVIMQPEVVNGLAGFARTILWPLWVNGWAANPVALEPQPSEEISATLRARAASREVLVAALRANISAVLAVDPPAAALHAALDAQDIAAVRRQMESFEGAGRTSELPISVPQYLDAMDKADSATANTMRSHAQFFLLSDKVIALAEQGKEWRSAKYRDADMEHDRLNRQLQEQSKRYYAGKLRQLCASDEVVAMEQELFAAARVDRFRSFRDLASQLEGEKDAND